MNELLEKDDYLYKLIVKDAFFFITSSLEILRKTLPISLSVFWALFSVKAFYKACESPNFNSKRLIILPILHLDGIFVIALS